MPDLMEELIARLNRLEARVRAMDTREYTRGGDGGGVTDHGALTGLADDDHAQYHNDTRGDARYAPVAKGVTNGDSHDHNGGDGGQVDHGGLAGLTDADHPASAITASVTNFGGALTSSENTVQKALDKLDDHSHSGIAGIAVQEQDGTPSVAAATTVKVPNGSLTDNGSGIVSLDYALSSHEADHAWLASKQINIKDNFLGDVYPYIKAFNNLDGWSTGHAGAGAFTAGWPIASMTTGATSGTACIYGGGVYVYNNSANYYTRYKIRLHTIQASMDANCAIWIGMMTNPTSPTATEKHMAFRITNGNINASCGDGTNGNLEDTGVDFVQYSSVHFHIRQSGTTIYYYVNGALTNTFTTYSPTAVQLYPTI